MRDDAELAGAALFFGDSVITPAISVLSAVEGLKLASPAFGHWVLPTGATIIVLLFVLQKRGSNLVGSLFGSVMTLWLLSVAALGIYGLLRHPEVVIAANPRWAVEYMLHNVDGLDRPRASGDERSEVEALEHGFWRVTLRFGFAEPIDVPARLRLLELDPTLEADKVAWLLGHDKVSADDDKSYRMARWRARLFTWMARNATPATTYYGIPPHRLIEFGARIDL